MWSELPQLARHPHNDILTLPDENELAQNAIRFNSYSGTVFSKIQLVNLSKWVKNQLVQKPNLLVTDERPSGKISTVIICID